MNELTVLSYNIWFDETLYIERTNSLLNTIFINNPDIICLQEVKQNIYEILIKQLKNYQYYFPKKINKDYGCVTFSKYPIEKCLDYQYENSSMGRSLIIIKINCPYQNLNKESILCGKIEVIIVNSHFESLFNKNKINEIKIKQYELARNLMEILYNNYKNVILCADTNVMVHEENKFNEQFDNNQWLDSWKYKGSNSNNYTYDSENNIYLKIKLQKCKYKSRIDRIIFKSVNLMIEEFRILKAENEYIEPSDHFGVYNKFIFNIKN